jgi:hypothetical protein
MRYKVKDKEIRSENAAKPMARASTALVNWIRSRPHVHRALDYGCGKLRYTPYVARRCLQLGLIDSPEQLNRSQIIAGRRTTVKDYARRRWPSCRIYTAQEFWRGTDHRYDFILCANVLSAIPSRNILKQSLRAIKASLRPKGECLVVNQYRNSHFQQARKRPEAINHLDGWILASSRGTSYYGIWDRARTVRILRAIGFRIIDAWIKGESTYVLVGRN